VSPTSRRCARSPSAIKSFDRIRVECDSGVADPDTSTRESPEQQ
jgi:hypothetical protein